MRAVAPTINQGRAQRPSGAAEFPLPFSTGTHDPSPAPSSPSPCDRWPGRAALPAAAPLPLAGEGEVM